MILLQIYPLDMFNQTHGISKNFTEACDGTRHPENTCPCHTRVRRKASVIERVHRRREKPLRKPHTGARRSGLRGKHRKLVEFYKGEETRLTQRHAGPEAHGQNVHTGTGQQLRQFR